MSALHTMQPSSLTVYFFVGGVNDCALKESCSYVGEVEEQADGSLVSQSLAVERRSDEQVIKLVVVDVNRTQ